MSSHPSLDLEVEEVDTKLLSQLPKVRFWDIGYHIYQWERCWFAPLSLKGAMKFRSNFEARDDDIILASTMKTGTTWLKALSHSVMHRNINDPLDDILTTENPHFLAPTIEAEFHYNKALPVNLYDLLMSPRLFHTHMPYMLFPESVKNSASKIVYVCRNPKDTLISMWHFYNVSHHTYPLQKAIDCFCAGVIPYGSYFDHVEGYWLESVIRPDKILFVKYEEMKSDSKGQVKRIAEFMGRPFDEDQKEILDDVLWRCSLERLKNLEVNKTGTLFATMPNQAFFRKGQTGDWKNYLTPLMEEQIDRLSQMKLEPLGLFL
ncbi:Cytosolic sulfotransferase 6 [Striga hermonthica]|uniref:Sulfotransferase n=1 Tax=Striga hermonthica TaxID=68872 RepID=A0A9N7R4I5_STRHE|nr:Cytosolic sulfotransferase 6 [Striga hermonthica]